jgi:hypothetical protein
MSQQLGFTNRRFKNISANIFQNLHINLKAPCAAAFLPLLIALSFVMTATAQNTTSQTTAPQTTASKSAKDALAATKVETNDKTKPAAQPVLDRTPPATTPTPLAELSPIQLLSVSRTIFVRSRSAWVRRKSIEDSLMKKKGFLELGYALVKDEAEADLKLEVDHTALTMRYPYTVTHLKTGIVVATGTVISLRLLNDVPGDTAASFVKQARAARAAASRN